MSEPGGVAIVTGGAGGMGQAVVAALRTAGTRVAVLDRQQPTVADLSFLGDASDPQMVGPAVAAVEEQLGPITQLVCAAGVVSERSLQDLDLAEWRRVVDASLTAAYVAIQAVAPAMASRGDGSIVAVSTGYATSGYRFGGHYAAAKAGIEAVVKSVALELGPRGVRCNAVAPGPVRTPMLDHIDDIDDWERERAGRIPLGRIGTVEDLVGPILFLLGDGARYVTGQVLHVNGGLLMP